MGNRVKKIHLFICILSWGLWCIGLLLTGLSRWGMLEKNTSFFFNVVHPYNSIVMLISVLPVELIACIVAVIQDVKNQCKITTVFTSIWLCILHIVLWIAYIVLFVSWTGGV